MYFLSQFHLIYIIVYLCYGFQIDSSDEAAVIVCSQLPSKRLVCGLLLPEWLFGKVPVLFGNANENNICSLELIQCWDFCL